MRRRQAWRIRVQGGYRGLDLPPQNVILENIRNVWIGYDFGSLPFQFFVRVHIYE